MRFHWRHLATAAVLSCAPTQLLAADNIRVPASFGYPSPLRAVRAIIAPAAGPNILGTTALPIRAARFSVNAQHAFADAGSSPLMQQLIAPARGMNRFQQMAFIQSRVTRNIRWMSDATEYGMHDYWATATETLNHGVGDEEDRAILKLQALKTLGFNQSDLFLTLARDRVGGPITVLTTRVNGRYYVLDDTGGTPFPVEQRRLEFQPVLSFGWNGAWVHSRPSAAPVVAAAGVMGHK
jgi:predicted transglutaminase-like cysteine proteinase